MPVGTKEGKKRGGEEVSVELEREKRGTDREEAERSERRYIRSGWGPHTFVDIGEVGAKATDWVKHRLSAQKRKFCVSLCEKRPLSPRRKRRRWTERA